MEDKNMLLRRLKASSEALNKYMASNFGIMSSDEIRNISGLLGRVCGSIKYVENLIKIDEEINIKLEGENYEQNSNNN